MLGTVEKGRRHVGERNYFNMLSQDQQALKVMTLYK